MSPCRLAVEAAELVGGALLVLGIHEIYEPAALIAAGGVIIFVAQGLERHE